MRCYSIWVQRIHYRCLGISREASLRRFSPKLNINGSDKELRDSVPNHESRKYRRLEKRDFVGIPYEVQRTPLQGRANT